MAEILHALRTLAQGARYGADARVDTPRAAERTGTPDRVDVAALLGAGVLAQQALQATLAVAAQSTQPMLTSLLSI